MSTFGLGIKRFPQDFFNKNRRQPEIVVFDAENMDTEDGSGRNDGDDDTPATSGATIDELSLLHDGALEAV